MSKICAAGSNCPYSVDQGTGGCPCAELCPGFCEDKRFECSTSTVPYNKLLRIDTPPSDE